MRSWSCKEWRRAHVIGPLLAGVVGCGTSGSPASETAPVSTGATPEATGAAQPSASPAGTAGEPGAAGATPRTTPANTSSQPAATGTGIAAASGASAPNAADSHMGAAGAAGMADASAGSLAAAGAAATGGAGGPADEMTASAGPSLPAIDDPGAPGPFDVRYVPTAEGLSSHSLFVPSDAGTHGTNPIVVWTCGNGGTVSFYMSFLEHLASHGFFVVADKGSSGDRLAEVDSQNDAIAWVMEQSTAGEYSGRLDTAHIAVMGHSLGSLASFATAAMNEHVTTSIHYSGGLTGNPVGFDMSWLASMTKPAAFLCGGNDTTAGPACEQDFATAPAMLPVFYGVLSGADHLGPFASARAGGEYGSAGVAWLRLQLAGDTSFKSWFTGADCMLCSGRWTGMQRNLD